ncbi:MAG: nitronate monooxygenase [Acidiferrobacterales bacterium]|nr:nitronate monooxygenase [Acidiferrobacterales bacterium]
MGTKLPVLLAPMAGACPPELSISVANAGGLGACGVLLMSPEQIVQWCSDFRASSDGPFQLNNWIPDPAPVRDDCEERRVVDFLSQFSGETQPEVAEITAPEFNAQCDAMLESKPRVISSIMGIYPDEFITRMKSQGILWFATVTTVAEALEAQQAGADVIVAQGVEAGGHRGTFRAQDAQQSLAGLFSLIPAIADSVHLPIVATGGIADARGVAAALMLGASAVQIGTGFLRCPQAAIPSAWADEIGKSAPDGTMLTRSFTGRLGRSIATAYTKASAASDAPDPRPYPVQRALTKQMTTAGRRDNDLDRIQAWAGQSASLARAVAADKLTRDLWNGALNLLA